MRTGFFATAPLPVVTCTAPATGHFAACLSARRA
jgi:hypothetical protein